MTARAVVFGLLMVWFPALVPAVAMAAPADHCKPRSACTCQWETLDGKQQYVCRVKVPK